MSILYGGAWQLVRNVNWFRKPLKVNEAAFKRVVDEVTDTARNIMKRLQKAEM